MNPVEGPPPVDIEPTERPDLDWTEHEEITSLVIAE
jgi:hypothetical protein